MSYGRNFGMRSFENVVRDGRFRVPPTGTTIPIGAPVMIDTANAGQVKLATATLDPNLNICGVAVYEHIQNKSDTIVTDYDNPYDQVPLGQYVQMMHGQGAKVWLKSTAAKTLYDGRVRAAYNPFTTTPAAGDVGKGVSPDGTGKWVLAAIAATAWGVVEQVNASTGLVEVRLLF